MLDYYYRHKPSMLKKLTSAGLGFYNTKKMQKIGKREGNQIFCYTVAGVVL